jgi:serine/threonine protein kinase
VYTFNHFYLTTHIARKLRHDLYYAYSGDDPAHKVVLKVFDNECILPTIDPNSIQNDIQEMEQRLRHLQHPHIVAVQELGIEQGKVYIASEYLPGGSLRQYLDQLSSRRVSVHEAVGVVQQVGQAVAFAHTQEMMHLHIRPENIMLNMQGEVLLTDFSLRTIINETRLEAKLDDRVISYMAPEQLVGAASPASDQYALACLLYELITGTLPFEVKDQPARRRSAQTMLIPPAILVPELLHEIEVVMLQALEMSPQKRYADVTTFLAALKAAARPRPPAFPFAYLTAASLQGEDSPENEDFPLLAPSQPFMQPVQYTDEFPSAFEEQSHASLPMPEARDEQNRDIVPTLSMSILSEESVEQSTRHSPAPQPEPEVESKREAESESEIEAEAEEEVEPESELREISNDKQVVRPYPTESPVFPSTFTFIKHLARTGEIPVLRSMDAISSLPTSDFSIKIDQENDVSEDLSDRETIAGKPIPLHASTSPNGNQSKTTGGTISTINTMHASKTLLTSGPMLIPGTRQNDFKTPTFLNRKQSTRWIAVVLGLMIIGVLFVTMFSNNVFGMTKTTPAVASSGMTSVTSIPCSTPTLSPTSVVGSTPTPKPTSKPVASPASKLAPSPTPIPIIWPTPPIATTSTPVASTPTPGATGPILTVNPTPGTGTPTSTPTPGTGTLTSTPTPQGSIQPWTVNNTHLYEPGDEVTYNGHTYICLREIWAEAQWAPDAPGIINDYWKEVDSGSSNSN